MCILKTKLEAKLLCRKCLEFIVGFFFVKVAEIH